MKIPDVSVRISIFISFLMHFLYALRKYRFPARSESDTAGNFRNKSVSAATPLFSLPNCLPIGEFSLNGKHKIVHFITILCGSVLPFVSFFSI